MQKKLFGFTLVEILVVISIISVLSGVIYASFGDARANSRDKVRKTSLKELSLALEVYKAQFGRYPAMGCSATTNWVGPGPQPQSNTTSCANYIDGLVPDFMAQLPLDPNQEEDDNRGFRYRVSPNGDRYKVLVLNTVESELVGDFDNEFARCPAAAGSCSSGAPDRTYAVYSRGAENW